MSNGFDGANTAAYTRIDAVTHKSNNTHSQMATTQGNFRSNDAKFKKLDLNRTKFNQTQVSGFGNFVTEGQGKRVIVGSNPIMLPDVRGRNGLQTTMDDYAPKSTNSSRSPFGK